MAIHSCDRMLEELNRDCEEHVSGYDCPDTLISYIPRFDEYGIIVHDGGGSSVQISFCPWCGTRLPESKRDRWFDALEDRGIDPDGPDIPEEFRGSAWWERQSDLHSPPTGGS
jgi:hypothetical protein